MDKVRLTLAVALAIALPFARSHGAEQKWLRAVTPNFELYTTGSEGVARDAILYFERVRAFFISATNTKKPPQKVTRIIGFRSEKEYSRYRPNEAAKAYYQSGPLGDCIVMQSLGGDFYPVAVHEYTHSMLQNSGLKLPPWLEEGMAELYATVKFVGSGARMGDIPPGHHAYLLREKWLDLPTLVAVGPDSPHYNKPELMPMFYAQSLALTHMLMLGDDYRSRFTALLGAIGNSQETAAAIDNVYGRSLVQVEKDLQSYVRGISFKALLFSFGLEKTAERPEIRPATPLESGLALAGLFANRRGKEEESRLAYAKLAAEYPQSWRPEAGLAYLALRTARDQAGRHFARAEELGSDDANMYFDYAMSGTPESGKRQAELLQKAVKLKPDFEEANYYLGFALYVLRDCQGAHDALTRVKRITSEQAPQFFQVLAYSDDCLGLPDLAKAAAKQALDFARTPADSDWARQFLEYVNRPRGGEGAVRPDAPQPEEERR